VTLGLSLARCFPPFHSRSVSEIEMVGHEPLNKIEAESGVKDWRLCHHILFFLKHSPKNQAGPSLLKLLHTVKEAV